MRELRSMSTVLPEIFNRLFEVLLTHDGDVLWYLIRLTLRCYRAPATGLGPAAARLEPPPQPPHSRYAQLGAAPGRRS